MNKFLKILNLKPFYRYKYTTSTTSTTILAPSLNNMINTNSQDLSELKDIYVRQIPDVDACTRQNREQQRESHPHEDSLLLPILPIIEFDYKTCYICYDQITINSYLRKLNCQHEFHKKCIDKWLFTQFKQSKNEFTCPLCRTGVSPPRVN